MAKESDDSEYWLLPQFLTDDDDKLFSEFKISTKKNDAKYTKKSCFGMDFQHEFGSYRYGPSRPQSALSSHVQGSAGSDHEDDYIAGLTQQLAHSTLLDSALAYKNKNRGWSLSGSPQSTLCSGSCGGCHGGFSSVNSNCASRLSSPPGIFRNDAAAWDLFYASAEEVARMRMMEGVAPRKPSPCPSPRPTSVPQRTPSLNLGFRSDHHNHLSYQQHLKVAQLRQQLQKMKQQQEISAWGGQGKFQLSQTQQMGLNRERSGVMGKPNTISTAAQKQRQPQQQQQQQPGSGMRLRTVCLGNPGSKRECAGTGVFLPRTPADTRNKTACSTVLPPDKVVQLLNLNLKTEAVAAAAATMNQVQELRLPQEWSY